MNENITNVADKAADLSIPAELKREQRPVAAASTLEGKEHVQTTEDVKAEALR